MHRGKKWETKEKNNLFEIRKYNPNNKYEWHRDSENRIIEFISGNGWKFQYDNALPIELSTKNKYFFIDREIFHRLLPGNDFLILKIYFKK